MTGTVVPSTAVTPDDHGAIAKVTAAFCTSVALTFLCTRLVVRWPWPTFFGWDDVTICLASIAGIVQMGLVFGAADAGFGKKNGILTHRMEVHADQYLYASDLIYIVTMYISRMAIVTFFMRLESSAFTSRYVKTLLLGIPILMTISLIILATRQYKLGTWIIPSADNAVSFFARWTVVELLGDIFDLFLVAYPIFLVKDLQMKFSMKVKVVFGVAFRIPLLVISAFHLFYIHRALYSTNYFFALVDTEIVLQTEMGYALIAATVPTLQIFLRAAKSSLLGETVRTQTGSGGLTREASRKPRSRTVLSSLMRSRTRGSIELAGMNGGTTTTVISKGHNTRSLASDSSERGIVMHHTVDIQTGSSDPDVIDRRSDQDAIGSAVA